jgi:L,D-peptidoglycan transpeptidase YkuD (ErfK/YbiS/YcfS/YnhG family)
LGERGLAWGRGLRAVCDLPGPCKQEGDRKAPAGFFALGPVFGDAAHQKYALKMPFLAVTDDLECVDDPDSRHYNQFASSSQRDWKSAERMSEQEALYALGVFVQHNTDPVEPGKGSAIFLHIGEGTGTAGCTALEAQALRALVAWLDAAQHPCLVQLPLEAYSHCQPLWNLPPAL